MGNAGFLFLRGSKLGCFSGTDLAVLLRNATFLASAKPDGETSVTEKEEEEKEEGL